MPSLTENEFAFVSVALSRAVRMWVRCTSAGRHGNRARTALSLSAASRSCFMDVLEQFQDYEDGSIRKVVYGVRKFELAWVGAWKHDRADLADHEADSALVVYILNKLSRARIEVKDNYAGSYLPGNTRMARLAIEILRCSHGQSALSIE